MKKFLTLALVLGAFIFSSAQQTVWKKEQLMPTSLMAEKIKTNAKDVPLLFNVGPMDNIKSAVFVGRGTSVSSLDKMRQTLSMENKTRTVVVYCGCCSYASCPNIKPAFDALVSLGFKNAKVLDLPIGLGPDWQAKGYPME
ncbi:MAG: rhodanese-like domain-containing protein [Bacteroidota bacterium]